MQTLDYGGEVAYNQSNNYGGFISIQDVSCTGQETSANQCNVSTDITPDCFSPNNIVRINCYSISKLLLVYPYNIINCNEPSKGSIFRQEREQENVVL